MAEQKRVFIAIDISDEARRRIAAHVAELRSENGRSRIKWERPEKLHLTLKLLGDTDHDKLVNIDAAVKTVASRFAPFELEVAGTGVFPNLADPRILWLGIRGRELPKLVHELDDACEPLGFDREKRDYHPHLTIARIRDTGGAGDTVETRLKKEFGPARFDVSKLTVYESQLMRTGSVYTLVSAHDLTTAPSS